MKIRVSEGYWVCVCRVRNSHSKFPFCSLNIVKFSILWNSFLKVDRFKFAFIFQTMKLTQTKTLPIQSLSLDIPISLLASVSPTILPWNWKLPSLRIWRGLLCLWLFLILLFKFMSAHFWSFLLQFLLILITSFFHLFSGFEQNKNYFQECFGGFPRRPKQCHGRWGPPRVWQLQVGHPASKK
jgi:hypothetical protein